MSTALQTLTSKLAATLNMGDGTGLIETLKATAFKGQVSDAQMTALMVVANQYGLNPWTKEIYAFPDKNNGIVPVVGVDGWARIINSHPMFDGMDFEQDDQACTCIIHRKDRSHPIRVTEYMGECRRANVGPWQSHPKRMLRHKAMIQCARIAFGYGGIYDFDEAERIVEGTVIDNDTGEISSGKQAPAKPALPDYPESRFAKNMLGWEKSVAEGNKVADLLATLQSKYTLSQDQLDKINALGKPAATTDVPAAEMTDDQKNFASQLD